MVRHELSRRQLLQLASLSAIVAACGASPGSTRLAESSAAAATPRRGGVLTKYTIKESATLDPGKESSATIFMQLAQLYSGLVRFDPNDGVTVVPDLALDWQAGDGGTSYKFRLRQDVKFHNGDPLTPEDVVFSLRRAKGDFGKDLMSPKAGADLAIIEAVTKTGPYEVQIKTKSPSSTLLLLLASPLVAIVPEKPLRAKSKMFFTDDPIGTGPFKLKQWVRGQYYDFERFDGYVTSYRPSEKLPYLDGVRTLMIHDASAAFSAVLGGQVDVTPRYPSLSVKQAETLRQQRGNSITVSRIPDLSIVVSELSMLKEPFKSNPDARRAVWHAIDRKAIAEKVYEGLLKEGYLVDPTVFPDASLTEAEITGTSCYTAPCVDDAKALLKSAGVAPGTPIEVDASGAPQEVAIGQIIAENLRSIGLNASFVVQEAAAWSGRQRNADFQIFAGIRPAARFASPLEFLAPAFATGAGSNFGRWSDPQLDSLLHRAIATTDRSEFNKVIKETQREILRQDSGAVIPIGVGEGIYAHASKVKGFRFNPTMYESWRLDTAWLES